MICTLSMTRASTKEFPTHENAAAYARTRSPSREPVGVEIHVASLPKVPSKLNATHGHWTSTSIKNEGQCGISSSLPLTNYSNIANMRQVLQKLKASTAAQIKLITSILILALLIAALTCLLTNFPSSDRATSRIKSRRNAIPADVGPPRTITHIVTVGARPTPRPGCENPYEQPVEEPMLFPLKALTSERAILEHVRMEVHTRPGSQHNLLSSLLYTICQHTSADSLLLTYGSTTCRPVSHCAALSEYERKRLRMELRTLGDGSLVSVSFCNILFPSAGRAGPRSDLTDVAEGLCREG